MAMACFRDLTTGPPLPWCRDPRLNSCMASSTEAIGIKKSPPTPLGGERAGSMRSARGLPRLWPASYVAGWTTVDAEYGDGSSRLSSYFRWTPW